MVYEVSKIAIILFIVFVVLVLGLSFYFGKKTKSASGYFAAGGNIHWAVNGIAFAGDYLSAASFLGICGMIAFQGYDGFLYSIGYLAGWIVALFLVAEPLKRLGKYTFADALDAKFNSRSIQLTASISTIVVSIFYLIPQMVGAGVLVEPLLGFPHWVGVVLVGLIVIVIVATAGMTSTTYVQFIKGGLLIVFSTVLSIYIFNNGLSLSPDHEDQSYHKFMVLTDSDMQGFEKVNTINVKDLTFIKATKEGVTRWFEQVDENGQTIYNEALSRTSIEDGSLLFNGQPKDEGAFYQVGHLNKVVHNGKELGEGESTGAVGPMEFLAILEQSEFVRFLDTKFSDGTNNVQVWRQVITPGEEMMIPGLKFKKIKSDKPIDKLNFLSLMLALFLGTASLPHVLIRYYTVSSPKAARKSTIIAIAAIGFFYILTLFMGLGASVNGVLNVADNNMSAPLLAKAFGVVIFSIISALAFATILGTVSGLIVASSGAIAHDFIDRYLQKNLTEEKKVRAGKIAAIVVGLIAILLGIQFKGMNVSFLVGWAFAVAASANFPAIIMLLFWKRTTAKGIAWSIVVGAITALGIILTSPSIFTKVYGLPAESALHTLDNPAIISVSLSFLTLIIVSLATSKHNKGLKDISEY